MRNDLTCLMEQFVTNFVFVIKSYTEFKVGKKGRRKLSQFNCELENATGQKRLVETIKTICSILFLVIVGWADDNLRNRNPSFFFYPSAPLCTFSPPLIKKYCLNIVGSEIKRGRRP